VIRETGVGAIVDVSGGVRAVPVGDLPFDEAALAALNPAFIRFSSGDGPLEIRLDHIISMKE